ncbi:MAG: hypothetical protein OXI43_10765 [Candidatus Poribacteria bacterium]|nr:hypothetical protein [Candidatus Poribacteria bacterium]
MKRVMIIISIVVGVLTCIGYSLESLPDQSKQQNDANLEDKPEKFKVYLKVVAENDLKPLFIKSILQAFSKLPDISVVFEYEPNISFAMSVVVVQARSVQGKTGNIGVCSHARKYFDNTVLKSDVADSNWGRVNTQTENLIKDSQVGMFLSNVESIDKIAKNIVENFNKKFFEEGNRQ